MSQFRIDHWPVSLAVVVPFLGVAAAWAISLWVRERRAVRRALRELIAPPPRDGGAA